MHKDVQCLDTNRYILELCIIYHMDMPLMIKIRNQDEINLNQILAKSVSQLFKFVIFPWEYELKGQYVMVEVMIQ